jgi:hypothetical protein
MKKLVLLALTSLLSLNLFADPTISDADKKWLAAIEKMVADGQRQISTPVEQRTELLKDWAKKNGYAVTVTKTDTTYRIELAKSLVKN